MKTEEVYWQLYGSPQEARDKLAAFRQRYNEIRPHWALVPLSAVDPVTPAEVYRDGRAVQLPAWQGWSRAAKEKLEKLRVGGLLQAGKPGLTAEPPESRNHQPSGST